MAPLKASIPQAESPEGYYGLNINSFDPENYFNNWYLIYRGNTTYGSDFQSFFTGFNGNFFVGASNVTLVEGFLYFRLYELSDPIEIYDHLGNLVVTINPGDLNFNPPTLCARCIIAYSTLLSSTSLFSYFVGIGTPTYLVTDPVVTAYYATPEYISEMRTFFKTVYGSDITEVEVVITVTEITITLKKIYQFPAYLVDFNQVGSGYFGINPIACP